MATGRGMSDSEPWHSSEEIAQAVRRFHEVYARFPKAEMQGKKELITRIVDHKIRPHLQRTGKCLRLEFTGSTYEGVKIGHANEFDIMVIKDGKNVIEQPLGNTGYATLTPSPTNALFARVLSPNGSISPTKLSREFFGDLQKCINDLSLSHAVRLRGHGPAVQMDISDGTSLFSVDMVLSMHISGKLYVAKPRSGDADDLTWRYSTSLQEKDKINGIDRVDNGCRKQCLRVLKALRERNAPFQCLTSFHLKMLLFHECDRQPNWNQREIGQRTLDLMGQLEKALASRCLQHYFNPRINLLANVPEIAQDNLRDRLQRLRRNKAAFLKLLE